MYFKDIQSPCRTNECGKRASFKATQASLGSMIVKSRRSLNSAVKLKPIVQTPGLYDIHLIMCSAKNIDRDGDGTAVPAMTLDVACKGSERRCGVDMRGE